MGFGKGTSLEKVYDMLSGMTAQQISKSKSTTFKALNHIIGKFGKENAGFTPDGYSYELRTILASQIIELKRNAILRDGMNPDIRKILGI